MLFCLGFLAASPHASAQTDTPPQPDPRYQSPGYRVPQYASPPWQQDLSPAQIYQNRKAREAVGTPYGTINGKPYRPQPGEYYTRSRVLHPQVVRGWGYDPNAANYGPDYSAGVLPADYPVPKKGSNVTFRLPVYGYPTIDTPSVTVTAAALGSYYAERHSEPTSVCLRRGRGVAFSAAAPAGYSTAVAYGGGFAPTYGFGFGADWYLASSNYPNAANRAIVPAWSDPYNFHFGPGLHRSGVSGHYRFPYYSYRRPWYYPGDASFQRNTQVPW